MKVLITGISSYIGNAFAEYVEGEMDVKKVSLRDPGWENRSWSGYDTVLHVAGIAHSDVTHVSEEGQKEYYAVNRDLTEKAAQKAKTDGIKQFIYMSSAIVYGESAPIGQRKVITKDTKPQPSNFYGDSKLQGELAILPLQSEDFHITIIRTPMVYGTQAKGNFPKLLKLSKHTPVFPKVANQRSMIYSKNLCEFIKICMEKQYEGIFLPQNAEIITTGELVKTLGKAQGKNIRLVPGCTGGLKLLAHMTGYINKVFGNLEYDLQDSNQEWGYCKYTLEQSVEEICKEEK